MRDIGMLSGLAQRAVAAVRRMFGRKPTLQLVHPQSCDTCGALWIDDVDAPYCDFCGHRCG